MSKVGTAAKYLTLLSAAMSVVGCDHATKHMATEALAGGPAKSYFFDTVRLEYAENVGSFLGLGAGLPSSVRFAVFVGAGGVMLVFLLAYAVRHRWSGARLYALALILGGGVSNLVDRVVEGRVVDFVNVGLGPIRTGIFNVADMALLVGLLLWSLSGRLAGRVRK